jgi:hypothetical protein
VPSRIVLSPELRLAGIRGDQGNRFLPEVLARYNAVLRNRRPSVSPTVSPVARHHAPERGLLLQVPAHGRHVVTVALGPDRIQMLPSPHRASFAKMSDRDSRASGRYARRFLSQTAAGHPTAEVRTVSHYGCSMRSRAPVRQDQREHSPPRSTHARPTKQEDPGDRRPISRGNTISVPVKRQALQKGTWTFLLSR